MKAASPAIQWRHVRNTNQAIVGSTVRRSLRGALLTALFIVFLLFVQGYTLAKTYITETSREQFAATIIAVPGIGLLYGEPISVTTPAGYMVWRDLPISGFIAAIWGLFLVTRLLRGDEEDGRWEMMLSGQTTARRAAIMTLLGCTISLLILFLVIRTALLIIGSGNDVPLTSLQGLLISVAITGAAAVFMGVGALTSQLSVTRRRAIMYGIVPLLGLFFVRSVGNVVSNDSWLKNFTPFGWTDNLKIMADTQHLAWLWPLFILALVCGGLGIYFAGHRDLGDGMLPESDYARPHLTFLGSPELFSFRLMRTSLVSWLFGCLTITALIAALAKAANNAIGASSSLTHTLTTLGGGQSIDLAFIGFGIFFLAILLMVMATAGMSATREQEAKSYLDNILVNPISRTRWLLGRLGLLYAAGAVICLVAGAAVWGIANAVGLQVDAGTMIVGSLSLLGPVAILLGIGTLLYGFKPRLAVPVMYFLIAWAFVIDLVGSVVKLDDIVQKSSLLHYVALVPAANPDWNTFGILSVIGLLLVFVGTYIFSSRDLESE